MVKTAYGDLDKTSVYLYYQDLKNRTFSLLYMYENHPKETFQTRTKDLICGVVSFQNLLIQKHPDFCKYVENLAAIIEPQPLKIEDEHKFVKRHVLNAVNIVERIMSDVAQEVADGEQ